MRAQIADQVSAISPVDAMEQEHISDVLAWLASTTDVFRRIKPATPPKHLVCYVAVLDPADLSMFLIEHRKAKRWLPPGGHMEPGELPAETAARELREELGIPADFSLLGPAPLFVTVAATVGADPHTDVSLWHVVTAARSAPITLDASEFHQGRWWSRPEIAAAPAELFDPHFSRFLRKVATGPAPRNSSMTDGNLS